MRLDGAQAGDTLIFTKGIAVEGNAIPPVNWRSSLPDGFTQPWSIGRRLLHDPGLKVVSRCARIATGAGRVHAMHDPTEGGIATGIQELAAAAGLGAIIEAEALPIPRDPRPL